MLMRNKADVVAGIGGVGRASTVVVGDSTSGSCSDSNSGGSGGGRSFVGYAKINQGVTSGVLVHGVEPPSYSDSEMDKKKV